MKTTLTLEMVNQGCIPEWANAEIIRLSKLDTFQPNRCTAVGYSRVNKSLKEQLLAVGISGEWMRTIIRDICDMARLQAGSK